MSESQESSAELSGFQIVPREEFLQRIHDMERELLSLIMVRYSTTFTDAQDILQKVYLKVAVTRSTYREEGSFAAWVNKIVRNAFLNHRRDQRRKHLTSLPDEFEGMSPEAEEVLIDQSMGDPLEQMIASEELAVINGGLEELPADRRELLNVCYVQGKTYAEIADRLGVSQEAVKSRLSRARVALREILKSELPERYSAWWGSVSL